MPGPSPFAAHRADLEALGAQSRRRTLAPRAGRDFASNDYLGLADSEALRTALAAGITVAIASIATRESLTYIISTSNEPNEKSMAAVIVSSTEIFIARIFRVPNGNEPRKLTSIPVKKIFSNGCIKRKYEN